MSISRPWALLVLVVGASLASCSPPTNCLRYSDCAEGLTCANSKCVPPPAPLPEAGLEGGVDFVLDEAGGGTGPGADAPSTSSADGSMLDGSDDATADGRDAEAGGDSAGDDATAE